MTDYQRQQEANIEDGWPYPDDDSDEKGPADAALEPTDYDPEVDAWADDGGFVPYEPSPYDGTYSEE